MSVKHFSPPNLKTLISVTLVHIRSFLKNKYTGSKKTFLIRLDEEWFRYFPSSIINL